MLGNYVRKLTILVATFIYIINYIRSSKRENDLRTLHFFDFFYLKSSSTGYTIQTYSFYSLLSSCIWHNLLTLSKTKVSLNILIFFFFFLYLSFIGPSRHSNFIRFAILSWTQDKSFYVLHLFNILHRQLIRINIRHFECSSSNLVTTFLCDVNYRMGKSGNKNNHKNQYKSHLCKHSLSEGC